MRRLSLTIFLSLLASLLLMAAAVAFFWQWRLDNRTEAQENRFTEALAAEVIPAATEGVERLQQALRHWQRRLHIDLQVVDAQGRVLAAAGRKNSRAWKRCCPRPDWMRPCPRARPFMRVALRAAMVRPVTGRGPGARWWPSSTAWRCRTIARC